MIIAFLLSNQESGFSNLGFKTQIFNSQLLTQTGTSFSKSNPEIPIFCFPLKSPLFILQDYSWPWNTTTFATLLQVFCVTSRFYYFAPLKKSIGDQKAIKAMNQNWYHKVRHLYFKMFFKKNLNLLFDIDRFNYWTQKECLSLHLFPKSISKNKLCIA